MFMKVSVNQVLITAPINLACIAWTVTMEALLRSAFNRRDERLDSAVASGAPVEFSAKSVISEIQSRADRNLLDIILGSAAVWVPTNTLNFLFVPKAYRVLPTVMVSTGW